MQNFERIWKMTNLQVENAVADFLCPAYLILHIVLPSIAFSF